MQKMIASGLLITFLLAGSCKKDPVTPTGEQVVLNLTTDKAAYRPGEDIAFAADKEAPAAARIRYKYLGEVVEDVAWTGPMWTWTAPAADYRGYMAEVYSKIGNNELIHGVIAVDVSSDWSRFPRYGFLSSFADTENTESVIAGLTRYHINGLQFYDWHYKHHRPLAGTPANPDPVWKDIINRDIYLNTVKQYITAAHGRNMQAMFYNLAYGATNTAEADGVAPEWFLFKDPNHTARDFHDLPEPPFNSDIYVTDPGNPGWQQYLAARNADVYAVFDFDGFHVDQLGDRGSLYDYAGNQADLPSGFRSFNQAIKAAAPDKKLVFNAVNQFGQAEIAQSPVDFLYTEVWSPNEGYNDLANIIAGNDAYSGRSKKTVLAAYLNYAKADNPGQFNTPGVLLADAVIFAFGGAHLELGEHMLGKEYFPNSNLQMTDELKRSLVNYYDFLVAYQNVLRDGGAVNNPPVTTSGTAFSLNAWPPQPGKVAVAGRDLGSRQVIHLLNFVNAADLNWRDTNGVRAAAPTLYETRLNLTSSRTVKRIWYACPDLDGGASRELSFSQSGSSVAFEIPFFKYWGMAVVEY